MKHLLFGISCLILFSACNKPTFLNDKIVESVYEIAEKEYKVTNIKVERINDVLWIHVPIEKLVNEKLELDEDALEKVGNISRVGSRVVFSSDSNIIFIAVFAYDKFGIELKMIRHVEDIKKVQAWYIAYSDFYKRMDIDLGFNPEVLGEKIIGDIYDDIREKQLKDKENIEKYLSAKSAKNIFSKIPEALGKTKNIESIRVEDNKALVYVKTSMPDTKMLYLIDVEFFDILKQLLILYLSKESEILEKNDEKEKVKLPIISKCWNLEKENWPRNYYNEKNINSWKNAIYTRDINFKKFIAKQLKRRIEGRFEGKYSDWKIMLEDLEITYLREEILVTRRVKKPAKRYFNVDADYEIKLIVAETIRNYQLEELQEIIIGSPDWKERIALDKKKLLKLKPKKWKRLIKEEKEGEMTLKDILLDIFVPTYGSSEKSNDKTEETKEDKIK